MIGAGMDAYAFGGEKPVKVIARQDDRITELEDEVRRLREELLDVKRRVDNAKDLLADIADQADACRKEG